MKLSSHIKQSILLSPVVCYFTDFKTTIVFIASFIFIDIDHYIHYVYRYKSISIKGTFDHHNGVWERKGNIFGLNIFHTLEVLLILFLLGCWHTEFLVVGSGFLTHMIIDSLYLFKHNVLFSRAFSFIEYFIRKRSYPKEMIY